MDNQALQELIALFLKINPTPSDEQFHCLARAIGTDPETLESVSYGMLSEDEDLLDDAEYATSTHSGNDSPVTRDETSVFSTAPSTAEDNLDDLHVETATSPSTSLDYGQGDPEIGESTHGDNETEPSIPVALMASACRRILANTQDSLENPMADPDMMNLQDIANNDGDPTDDDLGLQQETSDDGADVEDKGVGLTNTPSDVLTDDGVPDYSVD